MCASCSNTTSFLGWHIYLLKLEIKHSIDFPSAIRRKLKGRLPEFSFGKVVNQIEGMLAALARQVNASGGFTLVPRQRANTIEPAGQTRVQALKQRQNQFCFSDPENTV